jgi:DNA-binding NarL/FixJ family response regulator
MRYPNSAAVRVNRNEVSSAPIRVAIVEDDRITRQGLGFLISGTSGFACAAEYHSVNEALDNELDPPPDVILLDIHMPGILGSQGVKLLRAKYTNTQVVMLTVFEESEHVFESICNGACGYLLKKTPPGKLLESITEAHQGGAPMSPGIARQVLHLFRQSTRPQQESSELTPREQEVLVLLAQGYSYATLADHLSISVNTVRNNIRSIYEKLHVHTRSEAVSKAIRRRLI